MPATATSCTPPGPLLAPAASRASSIPAHLLSRSAEGIGMRSMARSGFALAAVVGLAAACGSTGASPASTETPTTAPIVTPSPAPTSTPARTTAPTSTQVPPTDGQGDELVIGTVTSAVLSTPY